MTSAGLSLVVPGPLPPSLSLQISTAARRLTGRGVDLVVVGGDPGGSEGAGRFVPLPSGATPARGRNAGLATAVADYVVLLQPEPLASSGFLDRCCSLLDADPGLMFVTAWLDRPPRRVARVEPPPCTPPLLLGRPWFVHVPTVFRRQLWVELGGFDEALGEATDLDFWLRAAAIHPGRVVEELVVDPRPWGSTFDDSLTSPEGVRAAASAFLALHRPTIEAHRVAILTGKELVVRELLDELRRLQRPRLTRDAIDEPVGGTSSAPAAPNLRRSAWGRPHVATILYYHRVATLTPDSHGLAIRPADFQAQVRYLASHCRPLPLAALVEAAAAGWIPERAVAVTLDDGCLDNLEFASPILCEEGVPATFFVNGDRFDTPSEFWWDTLERVLVTEAPLPPSLMLDDAELPTALSTVTPEERLAAMRILHARLLRCGVEERDRLLDHVVRWSGLSALPRASHRAMLGDELRDLSACPGHTIGAHTTNHLFLPAQPRSVQEYEMRAHREALEARVGRKVTLFSYPFGAFADETVELARTSGFAAAVTVEDRGMTPSDDRFRLPRIAAPAGLDQLIARLQAVFEPV